MNLAEIRTEIREVFRDPTVVSSLDRWINDEVLAIAAQFELPKLRLREPATLAVTTGNWVYNLSAATHASAYTYHKRVWRVTSDAVQQGFALEPEFASLDDIDRTHADTGDDVQRVVIEGDQLGIYPKANDTLSLWFYRRPVAMTADSHEPDGIPDAYHYRVLVPAVVLRAMRVYPDDIAQALPGDNTRALQRWTAAYQRGLYGDGVEIGMLRALNKMQRTGTPRIKGAALGSQLSGGNFWGRWN